MAKHMYRVDIENNGEYAFKVKSEGYEVMVNPKGNGISPSAAFLASLGACIGVYIRKYIDSAKLNIKNFRINVKADFTKEPYVHFKEIHILIDLGGVYLEERRKNAFLKFIKNCPIHHTLKSSPEINMGFSS